MEGTAWASGDAGLLHWCPGQILTPQKIVPSRFLGSRRVLA
ncbi:hypothetical protein ACFWJ5_40785 [Streptomyces qaidamensis]